MFFNNLLVDFNIWIRELYFLKSAFNGYWHFISGWSLTFNFFKPFRVMIEYCIALFSVFCETYSCHRCLYVLHFLLLFVILFYICLLTRFCFLKKSYMLKMLCVERNITIIYSYTIKRKNITCTTFMILKNRYTGKLVR